MCKRALCLIFAFLLSINTLAAVVGDNDGSAFITKAEFEALKTNFVNQIDQYNTSIDEKIDGSIASYLAGINLQKKTYLVNEYESLNGKAKWMNLAWGSIFDGKENLYDSTKTYRKPNFTFGDYITGQGQFYYQAADNKIGYQCYYAPISNKVYELGVSNFSNRSGNNFLGFDYFAVNEKDGKSYLVNCKGIRVNQGVFISGAYKHKNNQWYYAFRKASYTGEPGSLIWGDWDVWPMNVEDAVLSLYKLYYDRSDYDLSYSIPVCDVTQTFNGVAGIALTDDIAIQPTDYENCYCYSPDSWTDDGQTWLTKTYTYTYLRWLESWGKPSWGNDYSYLPLYKKILPWHKFISYGDLYVGASIFQNVPAKFGEGVLLTEAASQNGEICFKLCINVDEASGNNVVCSAVRFYRGPSATGDYDIYDANTSLEYEIFTDRELKNKYNSILHTGEIEDKYRKRIENNKTVYIKIDGDEKIKKDDYVWIKVFPYSSSTSDTICCGSKNFATLTIEDIYQKG